MALKLLNPSLRPLGQFDLADSQTLVGGECVKLQSNTPAAGDAASDSKKVGPFEQTSNQLKKWKVKYHKLIMGKPSYDLIVDDNVLYDLQYAGDTEDQNDTEPRIQEDTPALRTQHIFYGAETEVKRIANEIRGNAGQVPTFQPIADKHYALSAPLGTSALHTTEVPAWQVRFFGSELLGSVEFATGSHPTTKIPQLRSEVVYKTQVN